MVNEVSLVRVTAHASIGVANASPVSTATGRAAIGHGERIAPNAATTARNDRAVHGQPQGDEQQVAAEAGPRGRSGEATAAW